MSEDVSTPSGGGSLWGDVPEDANASARRPASTANSWEQLGIDSSLNAVGSDMSARADGMAAVLPFCVESRMLSADGDGMVLAVDKAKVAAHIASEMFATGLVVSNIDDHRTLFHALPGRIGRFFEGDITTPIYVDRVTDCARNIANILLKHGRFDGGLYMSVVKGDKIVAMDNRQFGYFIDDVAEMNDRFIVSLCKQVADALAVVGGGMFRAGRNSFIPVPGEVALPDEILILGMAQGQPLRVREYNEHDRVLATMRVNVSDIASDWDHEHMRGGGGSESLSNAIVDYIPLLIAGMCKFGRSVEDSAALRDEFHRGMCDALVTRTRRGVIAITGPAGVGKTTVSKAVSAMFGSALCGELQDANAVTKMIDDPQGFAKQFWLGKNLVTTPDIGASVMVSETFILWAAGSGSQIVANAKGRDHKYATKSPLTALVIMTANATVGKWNNPQVSRRLFNIKVNIPTVGEFPGGLDGWNKFVSRWYGMTDDERDLACAGYLMFLARGGFWGDVLDGWSLESSDAIDVTLRELGEDMATDDARGVMDMLGLEWTNDKYDIVQATPLLASRSMVSKALAAPIGRFLLALADKGMSGAVCKLKASRRVPLMRALGGGTSCNLLQGWRCGVGEGARLGDGRYMMQRGTEAWKLALQELGTPVPEDEAEWQPVVQ